MTVLTFVLTFVLTLRPTLSVCSPHFGTDSYRKTANMAPGGGASALGTKPLPIPGSKTPIGVGIYDQLLVVRAADPLIGKVQ